MWRADSLEKILMLGKTEGKRRRGQQRMRWLDNNSITSSMDMNLSKLQETVEDKGAWRAAVHGVTKSQTRLSEWTTTGRPAEQADKQPKGDVRKCENRIWFRQITMYIRGKRCVWRKLQKIFIKGNICLWGVSNRILRFLEHFSISKMFYYNMLHVYSYVSLEDCITYWKEKDGSHPKLWTMFLKVFTIWNKRPLSHN